METYINKINKYNSNQLENYFNQKSLSTLKIIENHLRQSYHKGRELVDDFKYDILVDVIKEKEPSFIPPVGETVEAVGKISLPYWLGSMDKIKPENSNKITNWLNKNISEEYIVESKLDGVSCLLVSNNNIVSLYTRGDGNVGTDISHLARHIKNIPKRNLENIALRGELIMKINTFADKYSSEYKNARNLVSGVVNRKTLSPIIEDIDFVAYEIVSFDNSQQVREIEKPSFQLKFMRKMGFQVVDYDIIEDINIDVLAEKLAEFKQNSLYEMDGLIVQPDARYTRNISGNPDYAFAFKILSEVAEARVVGVEWNVSKWGALKPRVRIEPVELAGVSITYATGFNGKFINDNKIGPGSVILITRSGDVIPYILKILVQTEADMPTGVEYTWNETGVDIVTDGSDNICINRLKSFFSQLNIKFMGEATIKKLYEHGFDNLLKIIDASKEDLLRIDGFKQKTVDRIHNNIHTTLSNIPLVDVLGASGIFGQGIGSRKLKVLFDEIPDILEIHGNMSREELLNRILDVNGFSGKTANKIINNLVFAEKLRDKMIEKGVTFSNIIPQQNDNTNNSLSGTKIVFSGFRDAELEKKINDRGGMVTNSVSKNTTCVVVKNKDDDTSKVIKARELNIAIYTKEEFTEMFLQ